MLSIRTIGSTTGISPTVLARARVVAAEHAQLSEQLASSYDSTIAKKVGELSETKTRLDEWQNAQTVAKPQPLRDLAVKTHDSQTLDELQKLLADPSTDAELRDLAADDVAPSTAALTTFSQLLKTSLIPPHPFAHLGCLLEIRPGAGGNEAALFASDLLRMYTALCKRLGFRARILKLDSAAASGGDDQIAEAVLEIDGERAYEALRCEAGVHRVQRVPATEKQGRTHTSAVSVLVLPSFPENPADVLGAESFADPSSDYFVDPKDVRTDVMRARGAGGQHVNTTDSAVRLTHVPTSTVVAIQDSRSQHANRAKAWQILRARLAQARREAREDELARLRLSVVGVARMGRGDKIRTYNWSQQRVTDHRSGTTVHDLDDVLEGGPGLETVMRSVREWLVERDLEALGAEEQAARR